jgi:hypothetical protein
MALCGVRVGLVWRAGGMKREFVWSFCCRSNAARVPRASIPREMSFRRKLTSVVVLGVTGIGALSIFDDYLVFQQCSQ